MKKRSHSVISKIKVTIIAVILLISLVQTEFNLSQTLIQKQLPEVYFKNAVPGNFA